MIFNVMEFVNESLFFDEVSIMDKAQQFVRGG
jgi:hypothetical protein